MTHSGPKEVTAKAFFEAVLIPLLLDDPLWAITDKYQWTGTVS